MISKRKQNKRNKNEGYKAVGVYANCAFLEQCAHVVCTGHAEFMQKTLVAVEFMVTPASSGYIVQV